MESAQKRIESLHESTTCVKTSINFLETTLSFDHVLVSSVLVQNLGVG